MHKAVVFDVDGVLIDSYHAHYQSWVDVAEESSITFTPEQFSATFGRTSRDIIREVWPSGEKMSDSEVISLDDRKEEVFRQIIREKFPSMDGAAALVEQLATNGYSVALGSSGPPENIALVIEQLGIDSWIKAVITGSDVTQGKPHPQVFQLAAQKLSTPPDCCVVVEDAAAGVTAAHRAGMIAVGLVSTGRTHEDLNEAELIVSSLRELSPDTMSRLLNAQP